MKEVYYYIFDLVVILAAGTAIAMKWLPSSVGVPVIVAALGHAGGVLTPTPQAVEKSMVQKNGKDGQQADTKTTLGPKG
jgi:hypothetical protein